MQLFRNDFTHGSNAAIEPLVFERRTHNLQHPVVICEAWTAALLVLREQTLISLPADMPQDNPLGDLCWWVQYSGHTNLLPPTFQLSGTPPVRTKWRRTSQNLFTAVAHIAICPLPSKA